MKEKKANLWHAMETGDVLSSLRTDVHRGLSGKQASLRRRRCGGDNAIWRVHRASTVHTAFGEFLDLSAILLLITSIVSAIFERTTEALLLTGILLVSATVRTVIFLAAQRVFEDAARANIPRASVIRDGKSLTVSADSVVPGDILYITAGDPVPADVRLLFGEVLVAESFVTENSRLQKKSASGVCPSDAACEVRSNILFAGSTVISGSARGVVFASGEDTYIFAKHGYISVPAGEDLSVLHKLSGWCRNVSLIMIAAILVISLGGLFIGRGELTLDVLFLSAVSLAVASMSEFLCVIAAIILSVSVQRLRTRSGGTTILRAADSIESFAKAKFVIFSDASLLQSGHIQLHSAYINGAELTTAEELREEDTLRVLTLALLCRFGSLRPLSDGAANITPDVCTEGIRRVYEQYPEEQRNRISVPNVIAENHSENVHTILTNGSEGTIAYVSGEIESILPFCSFVQTKDGVHPLREAERRALTERARWMDGQSIRTAAVAVRVSLYDNLSKINVVQTKMIFLGYCAFVNPVDADFALIISQCRMSDVRLIVFSKDEKERLLVTKAGILDEDSPVLTSAQDVIAFAGDFPSRLSSDDISPKGACVLASDRSARAEFVRAISKQCPNTVYVGDTIRDIPLFNHVSASVAAENTFFSAPQCLLSAADVSVSNKETPGTSCAASVFEIISACKSAFLHLRDATDYLLTVQAFRMTLMFAAAFLGMPLHTPGQTLWWGLILDFSAVLTFAFAGTSDNAMCIHEAQLSFPTIRKGVVFPVSLGVLSGLILSLANAYMIRGYTEEAALSFSYIGGVVVSFLLLLSVFISRRMPRKRSFRMNAAMLVYLILFALTVVFSWELVHWQGIVLLLLICTVPSLIRLLYVHLFSESEWRQSFKK